MKGVYDKIYNDGSRMRTGRSLCSSVSIHQGLTGTIDFNDPTRKRKNLICKANVREAGAAG